MKYYIDAVTADKCHLSYALDARDMEHALLRFKDLHRFSNEPMSVERISQKPTRGASYSEIEL